MSSAAPIASPELRHPHRNDALAVRREDIHFRASDHGSLEVRIRVRNRGSETSTPTLARIELAAFGAFLPWVPLGEVRVPPVLPGGEVVIGYETPRVGLDAADDDVPPSGRRFTATGSDEGRPGYGSLEADMRRRREEYRQTLLRSGRVPPLLVEMIRIMQEERAHFAANLNVFIGPTPVERHIAQGIQILPGRTNLAKFVVGDRPDAYAFTATAPDPTWEVDVLGGAETVVPPGEWITQDGPAIYLARMRAPDHAVAGKVDVHVRRRSTGEATTVEFELVS